MNTTKQYSKLQFGYRAKFSTNDALLYCTEKWRKLVDNGKYVAVASLDLSKAFDSIDHQILMHKLNELGFNKSARNIIGQYLHHRKQSVKVNGVMSQWLDVKYRVPQRTVLGATSLHACK